MKTISNGAKESRFKYYLLFFATIPFLIWVISWRFDDWRNQFGILLWVFQILRWTAILFCTTSFVYAMACIQRIENK